MMVEAELSKKLQKIPSFGRVISLLFLHYLYTICVSQGNYTTHVLKPPCLRNSAILRSMLMTLPSRLA